MGVSASAQRLRARAFGAMAQARWMAPSADTWQWPANAAAVTGHASALILRSLASHPSSPENPLDSTLLATAAEAMARSWKAWRRVAAAWTGISTETSGRTAPIVTDIGDLVLRIGRLAWDDPNWTPARPHRAGQRTWADRTAGIRADVVAAVHQASDAFAQLAAADLDVVTAADRAGRLYVRTRELSADYDVPRPYATAPVARTAPLLEAYRAAGHASRQAAGALGALALAIDASSAPLALARVAADPNHSQATRTSQHPSTRVAILQQPRVPAVTPGPTERAIRDMRVTDPAVLVRATVIDNASRQLISQASHLAGPRPSGETTGQRRAPGHAAQLAAQDYPNAPASNAAKTGQVTRLPRSATQSRRPVTPRRPRLLHDTRPGNGQNSARRRAE